MALAPQLDIIGLIGFTFKILKFTLYVSIFEYWTLICAYFSDNNGFNLDFPEIITQVLDFLRKKKRKILSVMHYIL